MTLWSDWPLGWWRCWSYARFAQRCLVYPRPEAHPPPLPSGALDFGEGRSGASGMDDFAGLRPWQAGDAPRHVAWKAAARSEILSVKQFQASSSPCYQLDWQSLPPELGQEERLARLCAWVLSAHAQGARYALQLPGRSLPAAQGDAQRDACLRALALFGMDDDV